MSDSEIYSVVIGTAGHIDHGKSSIVRHLTGIDPDRLPEEKNRGLTIDLGFAPMVLPSGERVGLIDVPGHERFIKNMVAGASGIDLVLLVVAADDSVMPQTREHLDIMTLLGVERGMIVVNKIDLVDPDFVELVVEEVRELVRGTFLEGAEAYRVSAQSGRGISELRDALDREIHRLPPRDAAGIFRMPIQRVFSAKGHGTVVTGIPVTGSVGLGDTLEILPIGESGRVRGLQAYRVTVERARAGHSTAINLSDVDFHDVHRGMVACEPGYFRSSDMIEARVRVLPHLKVPLRHQMPIRFHTGTVETVGRLFLLESKTVAPGEETFAQFRLAEPIVVAAGDRFVFRQESPMLTLGGGEVLDRSEWRLKLGKEYVLRALERKQEALGSKSDFVASIVHETPLRLADLAGVARRASLPESDVREILQELESRGEIIPARVPGRWFSREGVELANKRIRGVLEQCFADDPLRIFVNKPEVRERARLEGDFFERVLVHLDAVGRIQLERGGRVSLPDRKLDLSKNERFCYELLKEEFAKQPFNPPALEALADAHQRSVSVLEKMRQLLVDQEIFVRVAADVVLHEEALEGAKNRLRELFAAEGAFTASRAKDVLETSRKFAIPLLEYLDSIKFTRRLRELRELVEA
ncbi:MAG: selenocysteine-specific translation elongation factor [Planctomycetes bacterium]|nr:selenocysteine-specific translation elongation factor [Planctomycetota bacterium]